MSYSVGIIRSLSNLSKGKYDIAYMNPYHFVVFNDSVGYRALARQKDKRIKGIVVVNANSTITSLDDLNGKQIAFPSPAAFAATIIPSAYLKQQGVIFTPRYVHSHDSVYLNVQRGFFNAGGGIIRTLNGVDENTRSAFRSGACGVPRLVSRIPTRGGCSWS